MKNRLIALVITCASVYISGCKQELFFFDPDAAKSQSLTLSEDEVADSYPIEVLGAAGSTVSATITIGNYERIPTGLKLKIHGLVAENMVSVKVNSSEWILLNDQSVKYPKLERAYFGMGGVMSTLRMVVPLPAGIVNDGENTIVFRYNDTDTKGIGYRVLSIGFVDDEGREISLRENLREDDPRDWTAPLLGADAVRDGKKLWYEARLKLGDQDLRAACTDCHAHDGRDLKYFNYSNKSIIERSIFHALSREEGEKIASYIRSLPIPYEEKGRPWNPPYQPGIGLDAKPVRSWAAGAGLDAVLDDDLSTLDYIFPNGITQGSVDLTKIVNAREIPLAVQLPDWNHWLPQVHPMDAYPEIFPNGTFTKIYDELKKSLNSKTSLEAARLINAKKSVWDGSLRGSGIPKAPERDTPEYEGWYYRNKGMSHWRVVKTWEMMTEYQAEDQGQEIFGLKSNDRRWFHGEVFRLGPHLLKGPHIETFAQESMQWYQLQVVLNDGNRKNPSIVPIDFGYLHALNFSSWNNPELMPTYGIAILNMIKGGEVVETGEPLTEKGGWSPFIQNIAMLAPGSHFNNQFKSIDINLRRKVAEAIIESWIRKAESYSNQEYILANKATEGFRNLIAYSAKNLAAIGVDSRLINRLNALQARLWPGDSDSPVVDPVEEPLPPPDDDPA